MAWGYGEAYDTTVRDLLVPAAAGQAIKVRISNVFGNAPLHIGAASVAASAGGSAIDPLTMHGLTFSGSTTLTIPAGALAYSDPVPLAVQAGEQLDVTLWVEGADLATVHPCCTAVDDWFTPNGSGNLTGAATLVGRATASPWERFVDALDVLQTTGEGSIVVLGDSITDGYNSTLRWTDVLQRRIDTLPPSERRAVVNEAITANALTSDVHTDDLTGGGPSGISRLQRDVLSQPGTAEIIVLLGTNDLWFGATADDVIAGYRQLLAQTRAAGIPTVAMTLLPRASSRSEYWSPADQENLQAVDDWITTSGSFSGVIDTDSAVGDIFDGQCNPGILYPPYDSGDHLHPNAAGQTALANAIATTLLGLPPLPTVPPLVPVTPTPGCRPTP